MTSRLWLHSTLAVSLAACFPLSGQVRLEPVSDGIAIDIGGKPFSSLHVGPDAPKPYLHPIRSASGKEVTRGFPMEKVEGESHDHPHQRGLWFAHEDVNGFDFWNNEFSYTTKNRGFIVLDRLVSAQSGQKSGTIHAIFDWKDPHGKILVKEDRTMTFYDDPSLRTMDFDITLTAVTDCVFGDAKDGTFGIRIADVMNEKHTGKITDSQGRVGMPEVWGKRADWVDYVGTIGGEKLGIAIFDHPANPGHPNRWHARDYGLFALNPFGDHVFDTSVPITPHPLPAGKSWRYRWRVIIHPGDTQSAEIAGLYKKYSAER